jgi:4-hydroxy-2-oxoheptanedioate aldolase
MDDVTMDVPWNSFKRAIRNGHRQIGLWLALGDATSAELCAGAGFDWLLLDAEHGPNDLRSLLAQLQAIAPYKTHPIVRPRVGDTHLIKQILEIGAQTLLIPMVEYAEQAAEPRSRDAISAAWSARRRCSVRTFFALE